MRTINLNKSEILQHLKQSVKPELKPGEYVDDWDYKVSRRGEIKGISLIIKSVNEK